ncbi:hypothetical protein C4A76_18200 [Brevibacillus laterosporus]|uniref:hypothetical protein n=1 Tax=Brevibacillus laterosporus TaxID=1465 RepID=UPI000CE4860E|nr:hypothetical protein [Brevibacillus laterosporus]PPA84168.1 hypothetical protein C4A76_18200 [Brevibacillus laterosporus]
MLLQLSLFCEVKSKECIVVKSLKSELYLTKSFLKIALKYRTEEELSEAWDLTTFEIHMIKNFFGISVLPIERLTKNRIKIMDVIQKFQNKYNKYPSFKYIKQRTRLEKDLLKKELSILKQNGYITHSDEFEILDIKKAV